MKGLLIEDSLLAEKTGKGAGCVSRFCGELTVFQRRSIEQHFGQSSAMLLLRVWAAFEFAHHEGEAVRTRQPSEGSRSY